MTPCYVHFYDGMSPHFTSQGAAFREVAFDKKDILSTKLHFYNCTSQGAAFCEVSRDKQEL